MFNLSERIGAFCIKIAEDKGKLDEELKQEFLFVVDYYIKKLTFILTFSVLFAIAFIINEAIAINSVVMAITFYTIRKNFGGFHFNSELICFIVSILTPYICGSIATYIDFPFLIVVIINVILLAQIKLHGVVDHPNKQLPPNIREKLLRRGYFVFVVLLYLNLTIYFYYKNISVSMTLAQIFSIMSLVAGRKLNFKTSL